MKKVLSIVLAMLLALSVFACTPKPGPGESGNEPDAAPTVVDGDVYKHTFNDTEATFALPKIVYSKSGTDALNQEIRDTLYAEYLAKVKVPADKGEFPRYARMSYMWGTKGGYLSIAEFCPIYASEGQDLYVFHYDLNAMKATDAYSVLTPYGITPEAFHAQAKNVIAQNMYDNLKSALTGSDIYDKLYAEQIYSRTLSDDNVNAALPFIGENGALMVQCTMGSIYGVESYTAFLPYDTALAGEAKAFFDAFDFSSAGKLEISVEDGEVIKRYIESLGENCTFIIPKIVCPKGEEEKMNKALRAAIEETLGDALTDGSNSGFLNWKYTWATKDNVVSILMSGDMPYSGMTDYMVMNFDVTTGEEIGKKGVLALYGIYTVDEFYLKARDRMGTEFLKARGNVLSDDPVTIDAFNVTLDMEYVKLSMPFINADCTLHFYGKLGQEAGPMNDWADIAYDGEISKAYKDAYDKVLVINGESIFIVYSNHSLGIKNANFDLPKIICRNGNEAEANKVLTAAVKDFLGDSITDKTKGGTYSDLHYSWGVKDHYVSVLFWSQAGPSDHDDYRSVTIDLNTGKAMEDRSVIELFGLTDKDEYMKQVMDRMGTEYLEQFKDVEIDDFVIMGLELTCEFNHVYLARPVIGADGTLYIAAPLGSPAGSGIDWHVFPFKGAVSDLYKNMYDQYIKVH